MCVNAGFIASDWAWLHGTLLGYRGLGLGRGDRWACPGCGDSIQQLLLDKQYLSIQYYSQLLLDKQYLVYQASPLFVRGPLPTIQMRRRGLAKVKFLSGQSDSAFEIHASNLCVGVE